MFQSLLFLRVLDMFFWLVNVIFFLEIFIYILFHTTPWCLWYLYFEWSQPLFKLLYSYFLFLIVIISFPAFELFWDSSCLTFTILEICNNWAYRHRNNHKQLFYLTKRHCSHKVQFHFEKNWYLSPNFISFLKV